MEINSIQDFREYHKSNNVSAYDVRLPNLLNGRGRRSKEKIQSRLSDLQRDVERCIGIMENSKNDENILFSLEWSDELRDAISMIQEIRYTVQSILDDLSEHSTGREYNAIVLLGVITNNTIRTLKVLMNAQIFIAKLEEDAPIPEQIYALSQEVTTSIHRIVEFLQFMDWHEESGWFMKLHEYYALGSEQ